jgi:cytochrome c556
MRRLALVLALAATAAAAGFAEERISDYIVERQKSMRTMEAALAVLEAMAAGTRPYDPARAAQRAADIAALTGNLADTFGDTPASRYGATSRAADSVWTNPGDFATRMALMDEQAFRLIDEARSGDPWRFASAVAETRSRCESCHAIYLKP